MSGGIEPVADARGPPGDHDPDAIDNVPRDAFPEDLKLEPGLQLSAEDEDGSVLPCIVKDDARSTLVTMYNCPFSIDSRNDCPTVGRMAASFR